MRRPNLGIGIGLVVAVMLATAATGAGAEDGVRKLQGVAKERAEGATKDLKDQKEEIKANMEKKQKLRGQQKAFEGHSLAPGRSVDPGVLRNPAAAELQRQTEGASTAPTQKPAEFRLGDVLPEGQKPAEFKLDKSLSPALKKKKSDAKGDD